MVSWRERAKAAKERLRKHNRDTMAEDDGSLMLMSMINDLENLITDLRRIVDLMDEGKEKD